MKAHISLRVSSKRQAERGVSISRDDDRGFQEERCRALCEFKGWNVASVGIEAGLTGRRKGIAKRDVLAKQAAKACADKGVLVVYSISRIGRSAGYIHNMADMLEDAGAHIASATEDVNTTTAMGRAFFGMTAVFAQVESDQLSERMRATHDHIKRKLGYTTMGCQPAGWKLEHGLRVPCERERAILARVVELASQMSDREAAAALDAEGTPTIGALREWKCSGAWNRAKVRAIVEGVKRPPAGLPHTVETARV